MKIELSPDSLAPSLAASGWTNRCSSTPPTVKARPLDFSASTSSPTVKESRLLPPAASTATTEVPLIGCSRLMRAPRSPRSRPTAPRRAASRSARREPRAGRRRGAKRGRARAGIFSAFCPFWPYRGPPRKGRRTSLRGPRARERPRAGRAAANVSSPYDRRSRAFLLGSLGPGSGWQSSYGSVLTIGGSGPIMGG